MTMGGASAAHPLVFNAISAGNSESPDSYAFREACVKLGFQNQPLPGSTCLGSDRYQRASVPSTHHFIAPSRTVDLKVPSSRSTSTLYNLSFKASSLEHRRKCANYTHRIPAPCIKSTVRI
ncbi:hypothetical protein PAXRUDRAFT_194000 [Paxillus rubicundulus Ve08.2h10]|uniref:Uncharacterized protein n=1 Tax=Paxillus rubicundulus Ve08.2h10 TaxID=930991 RepID=A0A0D0ED55_9AGAM|nr:hypothetical protein PAXRUDRAFT_194000 [Paxillus rubicundulus Ve08.2h10]